MRKRNKSTSFTPELSLIPQQSPKFQTSQLCLNQESQQKLYIKIKNFVIRNNRKSLKKASLQTKRERENMQSQIILVRSQQQKQLMNILKPRILPVLVQSSPLKKQRKKSKSRSQLDRILTSKQKFMATYFADIKQHKKNGNNQQISYIFPQVKIGKWIIAGYIKGAHILLKGTNKKGKSVIKKYNYSIVRSQIRKNYQKWVNQHFVFQLNNNQ